MDLPSTKTKTLWVVVAALVLSVPVRGTGAGVPGKERSPATSEQATNRFTTIPSAKPAPRKPNPGPLRPLPVAFGKPSPSTVADLKAMERHVTAMVARVSMAVVAVEIGPTVGSGVVISPDGLILTAGHVSGRPNRDVKITFLDGKTVKGKTLGSDEAADCGLVRITDAGRWSYADVAGSGRPGLGDWVVALGHPGGFDPTRALVVRFGRVIEASSKAIRSDCTITTGDSGGPLLDMHGRVVGIHSYISNALDDNYHIPVARFLERWNQLAASKTGSDSDESRSAANPPDS